MFSVFRLFQGAFLGAGYVAVYCLFLETCPETKRSILIPVNDMQSGMSSVFVGLTGFMFNKWRHSVSYYRLK